MATSPVIVSSDLPTFFRQELLLACRSLQVAVAPDVEFYLVQMLCAQNGSQAPQQELATKPVAVLLGDVAEAPPHLRPELYRALGDGALLRAGFFIESFERTLIDPDYYATMGSTAYRHAANGHQSQRRSERARTFSLLADTFSSMVDLLNWVAAKSQGRSGRDADVLKLYERYARTRNERTRRILLDCGLTIDAGRDHESIH